MTIASCDRPGMRLHGRGMAVGTWWGAWVVQAQRCGRGVAEANMILGEARLGEDGKGWPMAWAR